MKITIGATKLFAPRLPTTYVSRERLIARLNKAIPPSVTLISAPAGFGKTTLLADWISQTDLAVAWISLDAGDNDASVFISHCHAAITDLIPTKREAQANNQNLPTLLMAAPQAGILGIVQMLELMSEPYALVLDDLQSINNPEIHKALETLIYSLPGNMRLVLATRADPPFPLARLRTFENVHEIRADDLRFTPEECVLFLKDVMKLDITLPQCDVLARRTEGWPAGLKLAGLSLQGRSDAEAFIADFSGSSRFIMDYLIQEVLQQQAEEVQRFLLSTSILNKLSAPLCNAMLGTTDAQIQLEHLERNNIFLVPLDDSRQWYRYHHLFGEILQTRLVRRFPESVSTLHERAAEWYHENQDPVEAVEHMLIATKTDKACEWIEQLATDLGLQGRMRIVESWLDKLPEGFFRSRPHLLLYKSRILSLAGHLKKADDCLEEAQVLVSMAESERDTQLLQAEIAGLRSNQAFRIGDYRDCVIQCQRSLEYIPESMVGFRALTWMLLGHASFLEGDLKQEEQAWVEQEKILQSGDLPDFAVASMIHARSHHLSMFGQLHQAEELATRCLKALQSHSKIEHSGVAYLQIQLAHIQCEWNQLESARLYAEQAFDQLQYAPDLEYIFHSLGALVRVLLAMGELEKVEKLLQNAEDHLQYLVLSPGSFTAFRRYRFDLHLRQGQINQAAHVLENLPGFAGPPQCVHHIVTGLMQGKLLLVKHEWTEALACLDAVVNRADQAGWVLHSLEGRVLRSLALAGHNQELKAEHTLLQCLREAKPHGFLRIFLDAGPPLLPLVSNLASRTEEGELKGYIAKVLQGFTSEVSRQYRAKQPAIEQPLVEPLTNRELEVLQLLAQGCANREIAERLVVSLDTVKKHTSNLYGKLTVANRTQAVLRAVDLGLLESVYE